MEQDVELLPDPERIVRGLRDTGYNFNTAVADIIDNSISACATRVSIHVNMAPDMKVKVYIADDGCGMDSDGLKNAMRYGSVERTEKNSLGKFGLGLKTASTAFCRMFSVLSRTSGDDTVRKVQWDLDYIARRGAWLLQFPTIDQDELDELDSVAEGGHGTLVVWDKVDRLLKDYKKFSAAEKGLNKILEELRFHISMVYQRYLDCTDERAQNVTITVNSVPVSPWDPFCTKEKTTNLLQHENVVVTMPDGSKPEFRIAAYIIPKKGDYSSIDAEKDARVSNDFQGIYVYRENRLIHSGDWFGFLKKEPHFSLLRVEFSFDYRLDELLSVDIKKSRILLIGELADHIVKFLGAPRREAEKRYRDPETENIHKGSGGAHGHANGNIDQKAPKVENSQIEPVGPNTAHFTNSHGNCTRTIIIESNLDPNGCRVVPVPKIEGDALWEPALVSQKHAVYINESHPFYKKIYGPYLRHNTVVEGLDDLLWALAEAENSTCNQDTIENYEDMRYQVSKILKKLVADLPDPETDDGGDDK